MDVQGAETSFRIVPVGTDPFEIIAVILRVDPVGTIEVTFIYIFELETGEMGDPATEVDNVILTGEGDVLVLSRHLSLITIVNWSVVLWANTSPESITEKNRNKMPTECLFIINYFLQFIYQQ
jgi:hypothetical protein